MKLPTLLQIKKAIKSWFTTHIWLKIIALILAILLWIYIGGEIHKFLA